MSKKEISLRDKLRAKTLGSGIKRKREIVKIDGEQFEVRQPSVAQRSSIMSAAKPRVDETDGTTTVDIGMMQVQSVICCTFVPGTNEYVFDAEDVEQMLESPAGSYVDKLSKVAQDLMNVKKEDAEGNSEKTGKVSFSTE